MKQKTIAPQRDASRIVLALALASSATFAQTEPEKKPAETSPAPSWETELPTMTVSAHAEPVSLNRTGVSVTVLNVPQLRREGIIDVSEAINTVPGVSLIPGGGLNQKGNVSNIAIRGLSSAAYTLPLVDGMRLANADNSANLTPNILAQTSLLDIGVLEIARGSQAALYGGGAIGGVILMETPEGKGAPTLTLFNEGGSFDSYTGNVTAQGRQGKLGFYLSSTYDRTNNDLRFANGRDAQARHAGHYENWQQALRLDYHINRDNTLTATYRRNDNEYNSYGQDYATGQPGISRYAHRSNLVTAKLKSQINDRYAVTLSAGYYGNNGKLGETFYNQQRNVELNWKNSYTWNASNKTDFGFSWYRSQYKTDGAYKDQKADSLENIYSAYIEHTLSPTAQWENTLALRWDQSSIFDDLLTARFASNYRFNRERTRLFGSIGSGYKAPSQFQRSASVCEYYGSAYIGNPDLKCEKSVSFDAGIEHTIARNHAASATFFWAQTYDGISEDYNAYPITFSNSEQYWTMQGVELALHGTFEQQWNTGYKLAYTYTQPKTARDKQIANTARQTWSADIHTSPIEKLTVGMGLIAQLQRADWSADRPKLDNFYTMRLYAQYAASERLTFHLRVENLTDQRYVTSTDYSFNPDYTFLNAGIGIYGGCTVTF